MYMHIKFGKKHSEMLVIAVPGLCTHGMLLPRYLPRWLSHFFAKFYVIFFTESFQFCLT